MINIAIMAAFLGLGVGCASTGELEKVKQQLAQVEATADQANTQSDEANAAADAAMAAAEEAKVMAEESAACCTANTEKMNRMFNEVQQK
jgi:hypothetical protein